MVRTGQTRSAGQSVRYRPMVVADAAVVQRRRVQRESTGVTRRVRSLSAVRRMRALCSAPAVLSLERAAVLPLGLASFYDCGKGAASPCGVTQAKRKTKETPSRMIRNQKPRAVHQPLLFSTEVRQVVELPTEKKRELQTALADLLLNALTGDDSSDSGETDDASQAHA